MPWWIWVTAALVIAALVYKFRRRIFHGAVFARELTASDFADGKFPPEFYQANSDMQHKVSDAVTRYYAQRPPAGTPPELLPFFGKTYSYAVSLDKLCQGVKLVDAFPPEPDGRKAAANISLVEGARIMGVTPRALQRPSDIEHELAHSLSWDHPELWEQCKRSDRYHWSVMFDAIGPYA